MPVPGIPVVNRLLVGDCRRVLPTLPGGYLDSVVTDPPYELEFMGKKWDGTGVAFDPATWAAVLRVLKPGGYMLVFGGTRTYHRMTCAIEDAGFEIRDCLMWLYGTGFPKGQGCLKPAYEPIILARKPGPRVMPLGVDACRVPCAASDLEEMQGRSGRRAPNSVLGQLGNGESWEPEPAGRYPANLLHDGSEEVLEAFAARCAPRTPRTPACRPADGKGYMGLHTQDIERLAFDDTGTAARFFYCAKASKAERGEGNNHPTVKPLALTQWLVRLVTPERGLVGDPFAGSGTTGLAARIENHRSVLIEEDPDSVKIIRTRLGLDSNDVLRLETI